MYLHLVHNLEFFIKFTTKENVHNIYHAQNIHTRMKQIRLNMNNTKQLGLHVPTSKLQRMVLNLSDHVKSNTIDSGYTMSTPIGYNIKWLD